MNFGQNAIAAYWESRTIRDQRWKLKTQQLLSVWPSQWASAQCRPLDSQPLERNQTSSLPRLINQSIQKKLIDGHSIRPDGNPSVNFYESFCWEGVWLSIIQYGSITITMSEDKKIYLTNCARHHTLQRCWHNLHSSILRMPLSTKGKEDVEQNLSLTITCFTSTWPTHWVFIRKTHLSLGVSLQLRINPRHQGQDIIHKGCRDDGLSKVLLENTGLTQKAQGNSNTWPCGWKAGAKPQEIQTIGSFSLTLVGLSHLLVPALFQLQRPVGRTWACNWNATKKCMDEKGDITKIACKLTGKHMETWISVCNHGSFRIDRNVSTAREPSSWAPPPIAQHHGHQRTGN